jgi:hypothetical protein
VRRWLTIATACRCDTLDGCVLFAEEEGLPAEALRLGRMAPGSTPQAAE